MSFDLPDTPSPSFAVPSQAAGGPNTGSPFRQPRVEDCPEGVEMPENVAAIVWQCTERTPELRPSAREIIDRLG